MTSPGTAVRNRVGALDEKAGLLHERIGASREVDDIPDAEWATLHRIALSMSLIAQGVDEVQKEKTKNEFQESINRIRAIHLEVVGKLRKQVRTARAAVHRAEMALGEKRPAEPRPGVPAEAAEVMERNGESPPEITSGPAAR